MARAARSKAPSTMSYFSMPANFTVATASNSPGRRSEKGFSGPLVSIIPKEAQHKKVEPSSPKISCLGQIKNKKKEKEAEKNGRRRLFSSCFGSLFRRRVRPGGEPPERQVEEKMRKKRLPAAAPSAAPRLGQIRRYQSGRETLAGFDWRKAAEENYGEEEEEEDEVFIPHSAPILVGGGVVAVEPKKEVNLWRRRDMAPPLPLQI